MRSKVDKVLEQLLEQIEQGNFARGTALPPERTLASQFGVSYMTARKAVSALVDDNYLERKPGVGIFVRQDLPDEKLSRQLGIILPAWETPEYSDIIIHASRIADQNQWLPKVFYCRFWNDRVIDEALAQCDALMVVSPESLGALSESRRKDLSEGSVPCVIMGLHSEVLGIDCVVGEEALPHAIGKLQSAGHERIALVVQRFEKNDKHDPYEAYIKSWRKLTSNSLSEKEQKQLLFELDVPHFDLPHKTLNDYIIDRNDDRSKIPFTSIIVPISMAWGAVSGIHAVKQMIPEDVSIILIGDRQEAEFYSPKFDIVKISLADHVKEAWGIIQDRLSGNKCSVITKAIQPEVIDGETVKNI